MTDLRYASADHPTYDEATKDHVRDWMTETAWLIAESYGAERECSACATVMRRIDRRQFDGSGCLTHKFAVARDPEAPSPWRVARGKASKSDA